MNSWKTGVKTKYKKAFELQIFYGQEDVENGTQLQMQSISSI
jgi:hypothetical protein